MVTTKRFIFIFIGLLYAVSVTPQQSFDVADVHANMTTQIESFPQEKIHLHTDRDSYVPGETIWFKAYLTDAATHLIPTNSRYLYAELIDSRDSLVNSVMLRPANGLFYGHLVLSEIVPEGIYTLRAYTRYMENMGDDYFFKKNIRIISPSLALPKGEGGNPTPTLSKRERVKAAAGPNAAQLHHSPLSGALEGAFDISFFPEGGNLVESAFCKVAFKAINQTGYAETISGELLDETGSVITSVETYYAGMGAFSYVPLLGKRYFLKCRNENGYENQFELPQPDRRARVLAVSQRNGRLSVEIRKSPGSPQTPCYLLAHCRGMLFHFSALHKDDDLVVFPQEILPGGIIQLILFDDRMNPLSERLVYNKNSNNEAKVVFQTDKKMYQKREKVTATIHLPSPYMMVEDEPLILFPSQPQMTGEDPLPLSPSPSGKSVEGFVSPSLQGRAGDGLVGLVSHFSIAITDDKDIAVDSTHTILSTLLLSSELKGYIENPAYYLQDNIESATALDYLMMTHGWRRYNIPEVVKGNYESPKIPFQENMAISGRVKSLALSRPVSDGEVFVLVNEDYDLTSTDETGTFAFRDFEYPDSTSYFIQALSRRGSNNVEIDIDNVLFPKPVSALQSRFFRQKTNDKETNEKVIEDTKTIDIEIKDEDGMDSFLKKAEQRLLYNEEMRVIQLSEVEVTAPRIEKKDEPRLQYWANINSDVTLRRENFEKSAPLRVADLLRGVAGVSVSSVTGEISIRKSGLPLVLIDGIPCDWPKLQPGEIRNPYDSPLEAISVQDVESIDIFKGVSAAMFGTRGSNGVISITPEEVLMLYVK